MYYDDSDVNCQQEILRLRDYGEHCDEEHTLYKCNYCANWMVKRALDAHVQRKHKKSCKYCSAQVLEKNLQTHITTKHFKTCLHCGKAVYEKEVDAHIQQNHPFDNLMMIICCNRWHD